MLACIKGARLAQPRTANHCYAPLPVPKINGRVRPRCTAFRWVITQARGARWDAEGGGEDPVDGRVAVLATITALVSARLERAGEPATHTNVALTERFI